MSAGYIGHPIAHCFVYCVLQGPAAGVDGLYVGAQQAHAKNIQGLAAHIFGAM